MYLLREVYQIDDAVEVERKDDRDLMDLVVELFTRVNCCHKGRVACWKKYASNHFAEGKVAH